MKSCAHTHKPGEQKEPVPRSTAGWTLLSGRGKEGVLLAQGRCSGTISRRRRRAETSRQHRCMGKWYHRRESKTSGGGNSAGDRSVSGSTSRTGTRETGTDGVHKASPPIF